MQPWAIATSQSARNRSFLRSHSCDGRIGHAGGPARTLDAGRRRDVIEELLPPLDGEAPALRLRLQRAPRGFLLNAAPSAAADFRFVFVHACTPLGPAEVTYRTGAEMSNKMCLSGSITRPRSRFPFCSPAQAGAQEPARAADTTQSACRISSPKPRSLRPAQLAFDCSSSTQVGAWSLAFSSPRAHRSTPAPCNRSAASGEQSR